MDLAKRMVALSGLSVKDSANPMGDIEIIITGLRPGEKLYEELLIGNNPTPSSHPKIMRAAEDYLVWSDLQVKLDALIQHLNKNQVAEIKLILTDLVSGYNSESLTVDWLTDETILT
jgi:FlaA1/EpsC-like NDP-sugar epimerase